MEENDDAAEPQKMVETELGLPGTEPKEFVEPPIGSLCIDEVELSGGSTENVAGDPNNEEAPMKTPTKNSVKKSAKTPIKISTDTPTKTPTMNRTRIPLDQVTKSESEADQPSWLFTGGVGALPNDSFPDSFDTSISEDTSELVSPLRDSQPLPEFAPSTESTEVCNQDTSPQSESEVPASPNREPAAADSRFRSPKVSKASKTFRSLGNRVSTEPARARAEEVNSGSKLVPKIEQHIGDFFGMEIELAGWFASSGTDIAEWVELLDADHTSKLRKELFEVLIHRDTALVSEAASAIVKRALENRSEWESSDGWLKKKNNDHDNNNNNHHDHHDHHDNDDNSFEAHTLLFIRLCSLNASGSEALLSDGVPLVESLLQKIAAMRWFTEFDIDEGGSNLNLVSRLFMLARMAMLATFGGSQELKNAEAAVWKHHGLELPDNENDYASPINYATFLDEISSRYPAYVHDLDSSQKLRGAQLRSVKPSVSSCDRTYDPVDPRELVSSGQPSVMPYVPKSIIEASELYKSRVQTTPAIEQLLEEQLQGLGLANSHADNLEIASEQHTNSPLTNSKVTSKETSDEVDSPAVAAVSDLYKRTFRIQKSLCSVAVELIMYAGKEGPGPRVHGALSTLWQLLQWFRMGHILMFEHLAALLFDCQFHLVAHLFCSGHSRAPGLVQEPYVVDFLSGGAGWSGGIPWTVSTGIWSLITGLDTVYDGPELGWPTRDAVQLVIPRVNKFNLQTFTHLLGISRLMVTGKTQRLLVVAELSVDAFKPLLSIYEADLWQQLLYYLKAQVPFTGKRWRYLNMELISAIYLYCSSGIDDNWLSGNDVTQAVRSAGAEEATLRALVERYNSRIA